MVRRSGNMPFSIHFPRSPSSRYFAGSEDYKSNLKLGLRHMSRLRTIKLHTGMDFLRKNILPLLNQNAPNLESLLIHNDDNGDYVPTPSDHFNGVSPRLHSLDILSCGLNWDCAAFRNVRHVNVSLAIIGWTELFVALAKYLFLETLALSSRHHFLDNIWRQLEGFTWQNLFNGLRNAALLQKLRLTGILPRHPSDDGTEGVIHLPHLRSIFLQYCTAPAATFFIRNMTIHQFPSFEVTTCDETGLAEMASLFTAIGEKVGSQASFHTLIICHTDGFFTVYATPSRTVAPEQSLRIWLPCNHEELSPILLTAFRAIQMADIRNLILNGLRPTIPTSTWRTMLLPFTEVKNLTIDRCALPYTLLEAVNNKVAASASPVFRTDHVVLPALKRMKISRASFSKRESTEESSGLFPFTVLSIVRRGMNLVVPKLIFQDCQGVTKGDLAVLRSINVEAVEQYADLDL
jgi:hypothetical protein